MEEWIDVNDIEPNYYVPILVFAENIYLAWRSSDGESIDYTIFGSNVVVDKPVTHWMFLPNPPKQ